MKDYFLFELRQLLKSKKTIGLFCLLLIYSGVYSFWQKDFRPIERVDKTEMQQRYTVRQDFLDQQAANPSDHWSASLAVEMFTPWNEAEKQRLDALADENWQAYARGTTTWYQLALQFTDERNVFYTPDYYTFQNYYAAYDGRFGYASTAKLMEAFSQLPNKKLSQAVMEQKRGYRHCSEVLLDIYRFYCLLFLYFWRSIVCQKNEDINPYFFHCHYRQKRSFGAKRQY